MKKWERVLRIIFQWIVLILCGYIIAHGLMMRAEGDPHGLVVIVIGMILAILVIAMIILINRFKN